MVKKQFLKLIYFHFLLEFQRRTYTIW